MSDHNKNITVLDCTLRDGGYYNNWDFEPGLIDRYFRAVDKAGIDVVEVGFRSFGKEGFYGPFAYSSDKFLSTVNLPKRAQVAVMVNASDMVKHPAGPAAAVDLLFSEAKDSLVSWVRVAAHISEVVKVRPAMERLAALGYKTGFNLMQVNRASAATLAQAVEAVESWHCVDVLYFADSLGNMDSQAICNCLKVLSQGWTGPIGIHAHDNMGKALNNTISALSNGATWADATMLGMGRGAGNARMEFLLGELVGSGHVRYDSEALLSLVMDDFKELQDHYDWGANLLYYMSARDDIHPTYVQTMYNDLGYDLPHVLGALKTLRNMEGHSFSHDDLNRAVAGTPSNGLGAWKASGWMAGRDVLLLGAGDSSRKYSAALADVIVRNKLPVLCLNTSPTIPENLITAFLACHPTRILADMDGYSRLPHPLIFPVSSLLELVQGRLPQIDHLDFGVKVQESAFEVRDNGCTIPSLVVAAYALAVATSAGAKRIFLAGFDGFDAADYRQAEMVEVFELYQRMPGAVPLIAITPTSFPVPQSSLFAPEL